MEKALKKGFLQKLAIILCFSLTLTVFSSLTLPIQKAEAAYSVSKANSIVSLGDNFLGRPYKFGARSGITSAFDCSSFIQYVYKKNGISLPRVSKDQAKKGSYVSMKNVKKGDLIFFKSAGTSNRTITHVAIYAGNNKILHTYGKPGVTFSKFSGYWENRAVTARRVIN